MYICSKDQEQANADMSKSTVYHCPVMRYNASLGTHITKNIVFSNGMANSSRRYGKALDYRI